MNSFFAQEKYGREGGGFDLDDLDEADFDGLNLDSDDYSDDDNDGDDSDRWSIFDFLACDYIFLNENLLYRNIKMRFSSINIKPMIIIFISEENVYFYAAKIKPVMHTN